MFVTRFSEKLKGLVVRIEALGSGQRVMRTTISQFHKKITPKPLLLLTRAIFLLELTVMNKLENKIIWLSDLASVTTGYPFRSKILEVKDSRTLVVQMRDACAFKGINWSGCVATKPLNTPQQKLMDQDILLATRGNHFYAVLVDGMPKGFEVVAAPHFFVIRCRDRLNPRYLCWILNQNQAQNYLELEAMGSTIKSLRKDVVEKIPIPLPPIKTQEALVKIIANHKKQETILLGLLQNQKTIMQAIASDLYPKDKNL